MDSLKTETEEKELISIYLLVLNVVISLDCKLGKAIYVAIDEKSFANVYIKNK